MLPQYSLCRCGRFSAEADAGTNICGAGAESLETAIATRTSQAGKPDTQSPKVDDALIGTSSAFSAYSRIPGSDDILHDSAPWIDIASSIRTVDAGRFSA